VEPFDLTGRVALVTGGNGGIGLGMAQGLAGAGANVMLAARNAAKGEAAAAGLRDLGADADFVTVDVTDEASVGGMIAATLARFGRVDVLVNNAGANLRRPPQDYSLEQWHSLIDTNLTSAFLCSKAVHPVMQRAGGGKIINVGSMFSLFGGAHAVVYGATKGGIVQLTKGLAVAWAADGIQVNAVLPGWIDTDLTRAARRDVPGFHDRIVGRTPAGRWGEPGDLAGVVVFLAGASSDFITGAAIPVDGGYAAQG
jgi:2-deoxy-D-gluconate 3-dehydrogenase